MLHVHHVSFYIVLFARNDFVDQDNFNEHSIDLECFNINILSILGPNIELLFVKSIKLLERSKMLSIFEILFDRLATGIFARQHAKI